MLFMVIEQFRNRDGKSIYRRLRQKGRQKYLAQADRHIAELTKLTKWAAAAAPHTWAGLQLVEAKLTARVRANP